MRTIMTWINFVLVGIGLIVLFIMLMSSSVNKEFFATAFLIWFYILSNAVALLKDVCL
jgi:inner membrane protein involved in colicin E2 resistance